MSKTTRTTRSDDRGSTEQQLEALRRENEDLKAKLARGPTDETWFTPGVLSVLFLGLFAAAWVRYEPMTRRRPAPVVEAGPADYNPPAPAAAPAH